MGPQCDRGVAVAGEKCPGPRHPEEGFMEEVTLEALYDECLLAGRGRDSGGGSAGWGAGHSLGAEGGALWLEVRRMGVEEREIKLRG